MARHNRQVRGEDQLGRSYVVSYQPDWFYQAKVTRDLENGRQSTKTLARSPEPVVGDPGSRVRTRIQSEELGLDFEITLEDAAGVVRRVIVETIQQSGPDEGVPVSFTLTRRHPSGPRRTR